MPSLMTISFSFSQFLEQKIMSTTKTKDRAATLIDHALTNSSHNDFLVGSNRCRIIGLLTSDLFHTKNFISKISPT